MILIDANLLIYAHDKNSRFGEPTRNWLEGVLKREPSIGIAWTAALAFLRLITQPRMVQRPLSSAEACSMLERLLSHPSVRVITPGPRHWRILTRIIDESQVKGSLIMDADIAALAIEYDATLCTHDRDFARFAGLRVEYPL